MSPTIVAVAAATILLVALFAWLPARIRLSRAKFPGLAGHFRIARRVARLVPGYEFDASEFFRCDGAPDEVVRGRQEGFDRLATRLHAGSELTNAAGEDLESHIADVEFVNAYRVPFQFRRIAKSRLRMGRLAERTEGTRIRDLDGHWRYDVGGSYGVNVFGHEFYKSCIDAAVEAARGLGPVLGPYHPAIGEVVDRLRRISGLDSVSFHMSGTEAVMQAVRLARFHTGRSRLVMFCGAYHGWWDGVQPTLGNERTPNDVYLLREMSEKTLRVIRERSDIACVLVNPIQAMHPNSPAPGDGMLVDSRRRASVDRAAYSDWLQRLRRACNEGGAVLIFDEVFAGFRLARRGAQEYFGVAADMVTYGKTLGGGLPVGVVCGKDRLMKRYVDDEPTKISFARGTFNSHPYVVCAMREFLRRLDEQAVLTQFENLDDVWNARASELNARLEQNNLPVRVVNLVSVWTFVYLVPSRYNWMLQFYLRAEGLNLSWVGTGRLIFSHDYTGADFDEVADRIVAAARKMHADGWWWCRAGASDAAIQKAILREMIRARLGRAPVISRRADQAGTSDSSAEATSSSSIGSI